MASAQPKQEEQKFTVKGTLANLAKVLPECMRLAHPTMGYMDQLVLMNRLDKSFFQKAAMVDNITSISPDLPGNPLSYAQLLVTSVNPPLMTRAQPVKKLDGDAWYEEDEDLLANEELEQVMNQLTRPSQQQQQQQQTESKVTPPSSLQPSAGQKSKELLPIPSLMPSNPLPQPAPSASPPSPPPPPVQERKEPVLSQGTSTALAQSLSLVPTERPTTTTTAPPVTLSLETKRSGPPATVPRAQPYTRRYQDKYEEILDRMNGCLFGAAIGDAVGTTVEFKERGTFPTMTDMVGGGPFDLNKGQWTDDTSMALCLAESLLTKNGIDKKDQKDRYVKWWREGHMSSTGYTFDIGNHIKTMLSAYAGNKDLVDAKAPVKADVSANGNGSLMRLAPVPMFFYNSSRQETSTAAEEQSTTTHASQECRDACRFMAALIWGALHGLEKTDLLSFDFQSKTYGLSPAIRVVADGSYKVRPERELKNTGHVVDTLESALACFYRTTTFEDGCLMAANLGGDADTIACVYGMLAGAFYGYASIRADWKNSIALNALLKLICWEMANHATGRQDRSVIYSLGMQFFGELEGLYQKLVVDPAPRTAAGLNAAFDAFDAHALDLVDKFRQQNRAGPNDEFLSGAFNTLATEFRNRRARELRNLAKDLQGEEVESGGGGGPVREDAEMQPEAKYEAPVNLDFENSVQRAFRLHPPVTHVVATKETRGLRLEMFRKLLRHLVFEKEMPEVYIVLLLRSRHKTDLEIVREDLKTFSKEEKEVWDVLETCSEIPIFRDTVIENKPFLDFFRYDATEARTRAWDAIRSKLPPSKHQELRAQGQTIEERYLFGIRKKVTEKFSLSQLYRILNESKSVDTGLIRPTQAEKLFHIAEWLYHTAIVDKTGVAVIIIPGSEQFRMVSPTPTGRAIFWVLWFAMRQAGEFIPKNFYPIDSAIVDKALAFKLNWEQRRLTLETKISHRESVDKDLDTILTEMQTLEKHGFAPFDSRLDNNNTFDSVFDRNFPAFNRIPSKSAKDKKPLLEAIASLLSTEMARGAAAAVRIDRT